MRTAAIIVAAGRGMRAGLAGGQPKQYAPVAGVPLLARTCRAMATHTGISDLVVVIHPDDRPAYEAVATDLSDLPLRPAAIGGATRQASVRAGLEALLSAEPDLVLIHDAARPFVTPDVIDRLIAALGTLPAVIPGVAVADTLKRVDAGGVVVGTIARDGLWRAQTPQGFHFPAILAAHRAADAAGLAQFTDDAALAEWAGMPVSIVAGSEANRKITTREDLEMAERTLGGAPAADVRTGTGFDVHRFTAGDHVWIGGVRIAHSHGLEGHSDADAALHALTDAILGAIADGDIGQHFPPGDPRWKGAPSRLFLSDAARRVSERGGRITHVDLTILSEAPRIGPHRDQIRATIAEILGLEVGRVGLKATTTEGLGFTGRREGLAAMASATVVIAPPKVTP